MALLQTAPLEEIREAAARICRDYLTGEWKSITANDIVVKRISGGLSNFLYYVSLPETGDNITTTNDNNNINNNNNNTNTTNIACDKITNNNNNNFCNIESSPNKVNRVNVSSNKRQRTDSGVGAICRSQCDEPREVLLRIYGQTHGENALEAMISESVVFALLSERNFGPKLHGIFPGGRIEQFIPARPLLTNELSDYKISMKVAEKMGEIHSLNLPMSKEPDWLWNCIERWLKSMDSVIQSAFGKEKPAELDIIKAMDFRKEAKWLKTVIDGADFPVLFCHNDLQEGNILLRESSNSAMKSSVHGGSLASLRSNFEDSSIMPNEDVDPNISTVDNSGYVVRGSRRKRSNPLHEDEDDHSDLDNTRDSVLSNISSEDCDPDLIIIDFEYCAYNYRGFDLANHFLEWTIDYSNPNFPFYYYRKFQYPTKQQRHDFIATYLRKLNEASAAYYTPTEEEILRVEREIRIFSMFSHLFWSLWSAVNIGSKIEFGYLEYAVTRINEYNILKNEFLSSSN